MINLTRTVKTKIKKGTLFKSIIDKEENEKIIEDEYIDSSCKFNRFKCIYKYEEKKETILNAFQLLDERVLIITCNKNNNYFLEILSNKKIVFQLENEFYIDGIGLCDQSIASLKNKPLYILKNKI